MQSVRGTYNDKVVKQFAVMTVVWGCLLYTSRCV